MRWILSLFRSNHRRLEVSVGGRWYLLFTIVLGAVAIHSGNNVIYLLESLLLSGLILSGVLSELTISKVQLRRELGQAEVGRPDSDTWLIESKWFLPLYCLEISEWTDEGFEPAAFLLLLPARAKMRLRSRQEFPRRGKKTWRGFAVATSFPFGFARKIRLIEAEGSRIVWPDRSAEGQANARAREVPRRELEISYGDLEEVGRWEDVSRVHWPSSSRSQQLLARPFQKTDADEEIIFRFTGAGAPMEGAIRRAAAKLRRPTQTLLLYREAEGVRHNGFARALDALAQLPREGEG